MPTSGFQLTNVAVLNAGGLIDPISDLGCKGDRTRARDPLGRVYEHFLGKFAAAEGKLGDEFYTPRCFVRLLTKLGFTLEARL